MFRRLICLVFVAALVVGIGLAATRPWQPVRLFATCDELGYVVDYEIDPATQHMHLASPDRNYITIVVQGHYSAAIDNGAVSVNREPRCRVAKGDRLKITSDLRVWVNGIERTK